MRMIERVRLIEEIGAADGHRGVRKWVRGWRRLRWFQRAVDTMPALLHVVFDPIRYEELDYSAVAARLGIDVKKVEHRFSCALHYEDDHVPDKRIFQATKGGSKPKRLSLRASNRSSAKYWINPP